MAETVTVGTQRLLSGIRPSGALHLGHYAGALKQWLAYEDSHECFFMIADVQALSTKRDPDVAVKDSVKHIVLDWLAIGLDPKRSNFVLQSRIPELAELTLYLQSMVRTGELRQNPTSREEARTWGMGSFGEGVNDVEFGFLGYPVSQAADILAFTTSPPQMGDCLVVPVGFDQLPHVAFAAELAERFNQRYGETFLAPEGRTATVARLPGVDGGSKMGKSTKNAIFLTDGPDEIKQKLSGMLTDPLRVHPNDPGHPDDCACFLFREAFGNDAIDLERRRQACYRGRNDCEVCRVDLVDEVKAILQPIQERRAACQEDPACVRSALERGTENARQIAQATLERVREAMGLSYEDL